MYVDDLLIAGSDLDVIEEFKEELCKHFQLSDSGVLRHFLGMKFDFEENGINLCQTASIKKVLCKFKMEDCNPVKYPMEKNLQMKLNDIPENNLNQPYRELLGSLMYIMLSTRPDLCYSIGYLGRFQNNPSNENWQALKRVLRYLSCNQYYQLKFQKFENSRRFCRLGRRHKR